MKKITAVLISVILIIIFITVFVTVGLKKGSSVQTTPSETPSQDESQEENPVSSEQLDEISSVIAVSSHNNNIIQSSSVPSILPELPDLEFPKQPDFFPYVIDNYDIKIIGIKSYDGIYFENGKETEIKNTAAAMIVNNSKKSIEYARVTLHGKKKDFTFVVSTLPAGSKVLVQEANCSQYVYQDYVNAAAETSQLSSFEMSENFVNVSEENRQIKITNLTNSTIPSTRVFFKLYMNKADVYIGGITYTVNVKNIEPKGTIYVCPYHYAPGNSKIMMVKLYSE